MAVQPPQLDKRTLEQLVQQLLDEAKKAFNAQPAIPRWHYGQKFTEEDVRKLLSQPLDDAGLMLALIYARLLELTLERLNRVPEKNLLAFLDTMGVDLLAPSPAKAPLTFALRPGSPPTLVPKGAQAGAQPSGQQPAVTFETEDDLTVVPAQLTVGFTMDPTWDRYTNQTAALNGQNPFGFTPFVGVKRMPHILYLGDDALLNFVKATVDLNFQWEPAGTSLNQLRDFLIQLTWQYTSNGQIKTVTPTAPTTAPPIIRLANVTPVDQTTVQGVSASAAVKKGIPSRWLRAVLTTPFPDDLIAQALQLNQLKLKVSASGLLPDLAFSNTAPVDVTKDFFPFGETPKVGDALYLASQETFAKAGAQVTLNFNVRKLPPPKLAWEYFDAETQQWKPFVVISVQKPSELEKRLLELLQEFSANKRKPFSFIIDQTAGLTKAGLIAGLAVRMGQITINDINAFWVRVRLSEGGYNRPPKIKAFLISVADGTVRPPELGFTNQVLIDFGKSFLPFGAKPGSADIFYFGETKDVFPHLTLQDIPTRMIRAEVEIDPDLSDIPPPADLTWEYLGESGWAEILGVKDTTAALTQSGVVTVTFTMPQAVQKEVNGQANYWVRARIASGDYGRPAAFDPVDPDDPKQGFKVRSGTGNVQPPQIQSLKLDYTAERAPTVLTQNGFLYTDQTSENKTTSGFFPPFISVKDLTPDIYADAAPSFYLGFDAAFPEQPVNLYVAVEPRAFAGGVVKEARVAPAPSSALPPLQWEYYNGTTWKELTVFDGTNSLTESGTVEFITPTDIAPLAKFDLTPRTWIRARSSENDPFDTQQLVGVFLNTVPAVQAVTVQNETLGSSNGEANQTLHLTRTPILPEQQVMVREPEPPSGKERDAIELEEGADAAVGNGLRAVPTDAVQERTNPTTGEKETWVRWHEVPNFLRSDPHSRHYTLDHTGGVLTFGDGKRGLIPPRGTNNVVATYRSGGGAAGNAAKAAVAQVATPLPGVASVTNPVAADGGAEVETVVMVKERGPQTLRHRQRGAACGDLEWLARQAAGTRVARAKCLSNVNRDLHFEPGWVTLIIVPHGNEAKLSPSSELIREVEDYIEERVFVGLAQTTPAQLNVIGAGYVQVTVVAEVVPQDIDEAEQVKRRVREALNAFLHPLTGGPNGTGWEFGRDVYASEVHRIVEGITGVSHVKTLLQLIPNVAQRRLIFTSALVAENPLPEGSVVETTSNPTKSALLAEPVPMGASIASVAVKGFKEGDRIAISSHPFPMTPSFPMTVTSVTMEETTLTLGIEPYETEVAFPVGSVVATLDNRVRLPLLTAVPANQPVTSIRLEGFAPGGDVKIARRDETYQTASQKVGAVETVSDIVYLDDNFLVYPGAHRITMVSA